MLGLRKTIAITATIACLVAVVLLVTMRWQHSQEHSLTAGAASSSSSVVVDEAPPDDVVAQDTDSTRRSSRSNKGARGHGENIDTSTAVGMLAAIDRNSKVTLDDALRSAIEKFGPSDPRIAEIADRASYICNQEPDPYDSSNPAAQDPTREWAVQRILDLCRGFDKSKYHLKPPPISDIAREKILSGKDVAVQQAFQDIATSQRRYSLAMAGTLLFETKEFPFAQVLPDAKRTYGLPDLNRAWLMAVDLQLCREQGPCGPGSLQVVEFCRQWGCPPGVDLVAAYQRDLPPHLYTAVMAFAHWMAQQRS